MSSLALWRRKKQNMINRGGGSKDVQSFLHRSPRSGTRGGGERPAASTRRLPRLYGFSVTLLTDCYTFRTEMDGKTKTRAASRHIGDPQGAARKSEPRVLLSRAQRTLRNQQLREPWRSRPA